MATGFGMRTNARHRIWILAAGLLAASFALPGCRKLTIGPERSVDLSERFSIVDSGSTKNFEKRKDVVRKGQRRVSLVLVAPVAIRASLHGVSGKVTLHLTAAPVFNIGDGFSMNLSLNRAGVRHPVGNRYFDPGRKAEDRDWVAIAIPLEVQPGDQLEIEALGGTQGDFTADWLAISPVKLVSR
jgi:hypothetical protein